MPKGYAIFTKVIYDQTGYDEYVQKALPTVMQMGGRAIVVDDNPEVGEGQWHGSRTVILESDSVEAARNWYKSPEYQAVIGERHASTDADAAILNGFEMPGCMSIRSRHSHQWARADRPGQEIPGALLCQGRFRLTAFRSSSSSLTAAV